jgi:hypothetical protein
MAVSSLGDHELDAPVGRHALDLSRAQAESATATTAMPVTRMDFLLELKARPKPNPHPK